MQKKDDKELKINFKIKSNWILLIQMEIELLFLFLN